MRTKEVEEAIKLLKTYENKLVYEIGDKDKIAVDTLISYIETLEQLPNKIRDKIKELEEEQAFYERCGNDEMVDRYRVFKQVLKEILGE